MDVHEQFARDCDAHTLIESARDLEARRIDKRRTDPEAVWIIKRRNALQAEIRRRLPQRITP